MPRATIKAALAGRPGAIRVAFISGNQAERATEIEQFVQGLPLGGLRVMIGLSPSDANGQSVRLPAGLTWMIDEEVPIGEFHLAISRAP